MILNIPAFHFVPKSLCSYVFERPSAAVLNIYRWKYTIDTSKVPVIKEDELEEKFIKGHGPGGSAVNKTSNCVALKHLPTGIVIKCHESRLLHKNREIAREYLREKLDELVNGEMSVSAQRKRIEAKKSAERGKKAEKLRTMKTNFREVNK